MLCKRYFISGEVQGVNFRWATAEHARSLGLKGYARNLPDGRVEVLAAGARESLDRLERWLWQGPPLAKVSELRTLDADMQEAPADFRVLRD